MIVRRNRNRLAARRLIVRRSTPTPEPPKPPRSSWWRWQHTAATAFAVSVVALIGAVVWAWQGGTFAVGHVEVHGTDRVDAIVVASLADLDGDLILTADLDAAAARVRTHPLIKSAQVERELPGTVRITIEERQPWGIWEQAGVLYTIDRDGYVLGSFPPDLDLPVIRSTAQAPLEQGSRVDRTAVDAAAQLYELLPETLDVTVSEVAYSEALGVQVTTGDGRTAVLGDASSIPYKLAAWAAVATEARVRGIDYTRVDLRFGDRPVLMQGDSP